jgi:hypothetical protein
MSRRTMSRRTMSGRTMSRRTMSRRTMSGTASRRTAASVLRFGERFDTPPTIGYPSVMRERTRADEWLAAYSERLADMPQPSPETLMLRLLQFRLLGCQLAMAEIFAASLRTALEIVREIWESCELSGRAIWETVAEAEAAVAAAVRSFFGADWQEYLSHLRLTVVMRLAAPPGVAD